MTARAERADLVYSTLESMIASGVRPTVRELSMALSRSQSWVRAQLRRLAASGRIIMRPGAARAIMLAGERLELPRRREVDDRPALRPAEVRLLTSAYRLLAQWGVAPSTCEIAEDLGGISDAYVRRAVRRLSSKGFCSIEPGRARSLQIIDWSPDDPGAIDGQ